jgi:predicted PurR-regulated permease PerM
MPESRDVPVGGSTGPSPPGERSRELVDPRAPAPGAVQTGREVPIRTILATIGLVLASLLLVWILVQSQRVLIWMVAAAFFAVALYPVVDWVEHRVTRGRRSLATLLVFLVAFLVLAGVVAAFAIPVARQVTELIDGLPDQIADARAGRGPVGDLLQRTNALHYVQTHEASLRSSASGLSTPAFQVVRTAATGVAGVLTIFVLAYLMVLEGPKIVAGFLGLFSDETAGRISQVGADCARTITGYLTGNLLISVVCGALTYAVLEMTGVPFAAPLAVFVAIADLIPLVGATLGAVVAGAAAFLHSVQSGIIVLVFFIVYQQLENHLLQPVIYARTVKLNPLAVIVSILVAVELAGILGALIAIPVAAMIQIVVRDVWDHRRGRPKPEPTVGEEREPATRSSG